MLAFSSIVSDEVPPRSRLGLSLSCLVTLRFVAVECARVPVTACATVNESAIRFVSATPVTVTVCAVSQFELLNVNGDGATVTCVPDPETVSVTVRVSPLAGW